MIHNGNELAAGFSVFYRIPDYVESNFVTAPAEAHEWVVMSEESPVISPRQTREIDIVKYTGKSFNA